MWSLENVQGFQYAYEYAYEELKIPLIKTERLL